MVLDSSTLHRALTSGGSLARIGHLGSTDTAADVAKRCRALLLTLTNRSSGGLCRRELIVWLARYHELAAWIESPPTRSASHRRGAPVDRVHLEDWLDDAQASITVALAALRDPWRGPGFALDVTLDDWVVPFVDASGRRGWRPTDRRSRTLAERAVALLAADYLVRPGDYERMARQCGPCARVWFEPGIHPARPCAACRRATFPWTARCAPRSERLRSVLQPAA